MRRRAGEAISLGSCDHLRSVRLLTWWNGHDTASSGPAAFTVVPRCSPLDLVRLWCGPSRWLHLGTFPTSFFVGVGASARTAPLSRALLSKTPGVRTPCSPRRPSPSASSRLRPFDPSDLAAQDVGAVR